MKGSVVKVVGYRKLRAVPCRAAVIPLEDIEAVVDVALVIDIARVPGVRDVDGLPVCVVKGRVPSVVDLALAAPPAAVDREGSAGKLLRRPGTYRDTVGAADHVNEAAVTRLNFECQL